MPSPAAYGAALGLGVQLYSNAVRKLPLTRSPWLHVAWMGAGAAFGTWLVQFEHDTEKEVAGAPSGAARALPSGRCATHPHYGGACLASGLQRC
jgi:hypothetical protein